MQVSMFSTAAVDRQTSSSPQYPPIKKNRWYMDTIPLSHLKEQSRKVSAISPRTQTSHIFTHCPFKVLFFTILTFTNVLVY